MRVERRIDVTGRTGVEGELETAVSVVLPEPLPERPPVLFAFPGGTYGRRYYDMQLDGHEAYSQADHHTARGIVVVTCDHLCVGDSSVPDPFAVSYEDLAAANHATVGGVVDLLGGGTLAADVPAVEPLALVGAGQSMGGCLLTVQQANHRSFDAVALLGWSAVHTAFPDPSGTGAIEADVPPRGTDLRAAPPRAAWTPEQLTYCFHHEDEPPELVRLDVETFFEGRSDPATARRGGPDAPWGSATLPVCAGTMMSPGTVAAEAAAIDVPVLVGTGERDVVPDLRAEATAYESSPDITLVTFPRMAHMHNFAPTRERLWDRLVGWIGGLAASASR